MFAAVSYCIVFRAVSLYCFALHFTVLHCIVSYHTVSDTYGTEMHLDICIPPHNSTVDMALLRPNSFYCKASIVRCSLIATFRGGGGGVEWGVV